MNFLFGLFLWSCGGKSTTPVAESTVEEPCGFSIGTTQCNFILKDQHGEDFELYEHYGSVIILDFSAGWCYYCKVAASQVQSIEDDLGVEYVTILVENAAGERPSQEDLELWASTYDIIDAPVLGGARAILDDESMNGWRVLGWPTFFIIDEEMRIYQKIRGYDEFLLREVTRQAIYN
jgi:thiol-disulfide isomerase/thioredoxin